MADVVGFTRVYRAVSDEEYQQILGTGQFETVPASCEGKHFADTKEGARGFGEMLFGVGKFRIVEADVPNDAPSLYCWPNLDGIGAARFLHIDDLKGVRPRPCDGGTT
jgi:hypothetical protein